MRLRIAPKYESAARDGSKFVASRIGLSSRHMRSPYGDTISCVRVRSCRLRQRDGKPKDEARVVCMQHTRLDFVAVEYLAESLLGHNETLRRVCQCVSISRDAPGWQKRKSRYLME